MRRFTLTILIFAILAGSGDARPIQPEDDIVLNLPADWMVTDTPGYPIRIVNSPPSAEMLIFRSEITPEELVLSAEDLRLSVDAVIEEIILPLPEAKMLTNTGTYDVRSTGFILEFTSLDTELGMTLHHRFNGIIYRHPDGHQLLFTLWARGTQDEWTFLEPTFVEMQQSFDYVGPSSDEVFNASSTDWKPMYYGAAILAVLFLIVVVGRRQLRLNRVKFSDNPNVWRCNCGRLNHNEIVNCRRCGRERAAETVRS